MCIIMKICVHVSNQICVPEQIYYRRSELAIEYVLIANFTV